MKFKLKSGDRVYVCSKDGYLAGEVVKIDLCLIQFKAETNKYYSVPFNPKLFYSVGYYNHNTWYVVKRLYLLQFAVLCELLRLILLKNIERLKEKYL